MTLPTRKLAAGFLLLAILAGCAPALLLQVPAGSPTAITSAIETVTPPGSLARLPMQSLTPTPFQPTQMRRWGEGTLNRAAWSPDGKWIGLARSGGMALLEAGSLAELRFWETAGAAEDLAFSPDGQHLAVGELDGRIEIFSTPDGSLLQTLPGDSAGLIDLAFSPDGTELLASDELSHVHLWGWQTGQAAGDANALDCSICNVGFDAGGQPLAWRRDGDSLSLWQAGQAKALRSLSTTWTLSSAFNPDRSQLATGGQDGQVQVWQADGSGYKLLFSLPMEGSIWSLAYAPNQPVLAAGNDQARIYVWNLQTGQLLHILSTEPDGKVGETREISLLQFSPDGQSLLSFGSDQTLRVWNAATGNLSGLLDGSTAYSAGQFLKNGQMWGSRQDDSGTDLLDLDSGKVLQRFERNPQGAAWRLAISPDGKLVAANDGYNSLKLLDTASGKRLYSFGNFPGPLTSLGFSPDGRRLAGLFPTEASSASNPRGILRVWDLANGTERYSLPVVLSESFAFSPDGERIALGSAIGKIFIYEAASGSLLQTLAGHVEAVTSLAFSPDGRSLASGGQDGTLRLWDLQSGSEARRLAQLTTEVRGQSLPARIGCLAFSPAETPGSRLLSGEVGGMIRIWNPASGAQVAAFLGQRGEVESLDASPDGRMFLSSGQDGIVRLWRIE